MAGAKPEFVPKTGVVLVADDDPLSRKAVTALIARLGFEVVSCQSADELLRRLELTPNCAAVVTDVLMPGQSGLELATVLAARRPNLPVVLMSGFIPESQVVGAEHRATILRKPFSREQLKCAIGEAFARWAA